jgi:transposase
MATNAYRLRSELLGPLPVINHFLARIGLAGSLERFVPHDDARLRLAPAVVVGVVVRNLVTHREPVYAIGEWAARYDPVLLDLFPGEVTALNDDRVGRTLERLFDADRASLLTEVVLAVVREFGIDCTQLHNDSTSITFTGLDYPGGGSRRGGKKVPAVAFGHNKDHRPDLRQLVWVLTVSADGAVPVAHRVESGNTNDDVTHVPTWDDLVALLGRADFLYVSDCKLASTDAMAHIDSHGGRFVTILPANRREVTRFAEWIQDHAPDWAEAARRPGRRLGDPPEIWRTFESPVGSDGGFRLVWVHSSTKAVNDAATRARRIQAGLAAIEELAARLAGPRCRYKTLVAVEEAAARALNGVDAERWIDFTVNPVAAETYRQENRGRPGANTRYRKTTTERFTLNATVRPDVVAYDARMDGIFPLITNDRQMKPADVLAAYKYQPNLERRHGQLKGHQLVAPVLLKDPVRIEGLLCCHFFALVVQALIEREIRAAMVNAAARHIPLYPELRACAAPSTARVLEIFANASRHHLISDGRLIQTFPPELSPLQLQVLELLGVPASAYTS